MTPINVPASFEFEIFEKLVRSFMLEKELEYSAINLKLSLVFDYTFILPENFKISSLFRILSNLINNSVDANASVVSIHFKLDNNNLCMVVSDNGDGMDDLTLNQSFQVGFSNKAQGNGIGLSGAKVWIEQMGGQFEIFSRRDVGTKVCFKFPF